MRTINLMFLHCFFSVLCFGVQPCPASDSSARILSLSPGLTEVIYAIGAAGQLTGVSRQCDYPLAAKLKPEYGDFNHPDMDKIREGDADLVLLSEQVRDADLAALAAAGLQTRVFPARTVAEVIQSILAIGELTGHVEQARQLVDKIQSEIDSIRAEIGRLPENALPRVYLEVDGPQVLYSVGRDSFMADLIELAGGRNVFGQKSLPYLVVSSQEVIAADPEIILLDHPFQYKVGVTKRDGWEGIKAVRNQRIYDATDFDMIVINRPGPRVAEALSELVRLFHPEVFDVLKTDQ